MCGVELPGRDPGLDFTAILCEKISIQRQTSESYIYGWVWTGLYSIMDGWREFCRIDGKLI